MSTQKTGRSINDNHHVAGKAEYDAYGTIPANIIVCDIERGSVRLPKETLKISEAPAASCRRVNLEGFTNTVYYLIDKLLRWIAEILECRYSALWSKCPPFFWPDWLDSR